jgi:two-component system, OmpR family, KDP operon response regulator KdpE
VKQERVLVIDDEVQIRRAVSRALVARGYEVAQAPDGEEGLSLMESFDPDLVVLDLNMPGLDGFSVCRRIRAAGSTPILVLSVREDEADKVEALDLGADDYLTKPFGTDELLARVRALLRRAPIAETPAPRRYSASGIEIDIDDHRVVRNSRQVKLTKTEWLLLEELSRYPGRLLTHKWLLENVWGPGYAEDLDVLRVFVSQLRRKIEPDPARPQVILTDPGIGYRWTLPPE